MMKGLKHIYKTMKGQDFLELNTPVDYHIWRFHWIERIKGVLCVYTGICEDSWTPIKDLPQYCIHEIAERI